MEAFNDHANSNHRQVKLIRWFSPAARRLELNTDGCSKGKAGFVKSSLANEGHGLLYSMEGNMTDGNL